MGDRYADGRAAVHRLYHTGYRSLAGEPVHVPFGIPHRLPLGGIYPRSGNEPFGEVFVHGEGTAQIPRAGVWDAHKIKGGLDPSILPALAMEGQKYDVGHGAQLQDPGSELTFSLPFAGGLHGL